VHQGARTPCGPSAFYAWESGARAEAFCTAAWKQLFTAPYGVPPEIVYPHLPVMVDNTAGRIVTDPE
jgi:hypothetical protein